MSQTVGDLLAECLQAAGAKRVFVSSGAPTLSWSPLEVIAVSNNEMAQVFCDADGFINKSLGVALFSDGRLRLSSSPGEPVVPIEIGPADIPVAIATWSLGRQTSAIEIECGDFSAELPEPHQALQLQQNDRLVRLGAEFADVAMAIVAGFGSSEHADAVWNAAQRTGAKVFATIESVGAIVRSHPLWGGVVGLQFDDYQLLNASDVVIAVGCDGDDVLFSDLTVIEIESAHLDFLGLDWPTPSSMKGEESQSLAISEVIQARRKDLATPLHPVRAFADCFEVIDDAIAIDDPWLKAWCARMVSSPRQLFMPRFFSPYFSLAAAIVSALDGKRIVGICTTIDEFSQECLQFAAQRNLNVTIEYWQFDDMQNQDDTQVDGSYAEVIESSAHRSQLVQALNEGGLQVLSCVVRRDDDELIDIFGPPLFTS
ncbi:MAG: Thiamine pyrophosphate enzyme central domain [Actinomycetota bacterium]